MTGETKPDTKKRQRRARPLSAEAAALRILRERQVLDILGIGRTTLWRWWSRDKTFPAPIQLGPNAHGWYESVVREWIASRPQAA